MAYPRFQASRQFKFANGNTSGNATTTASWADVGTWASLTVPAQVGDVLVLYYRFHWSTASTNNGLHLTFSLNSVEINPGSGGFGIFRQFPGTTSRFMDEVIHFHTVTSGDLVSGAVPVKVRCKHETGAVTLYNNTTDPVPQFSVQNIGPVDPN